MTMTMNEYQTLAARTIGTTAVADMQIHAAFGMASEANELREAENAYACANHTQRGPELRAHMIKEAGDLAWMVAEMCTARGLFLADVVKNAERNTLRHYIRPVIAICEMYQKTYQGHEINDEKLCMWLRALWGMLLGMCYVHHISLDDVLTVNIEKLRARYPDGFEAEKSLHRAEGDD